MAHRRLNPEKILQRVLDEEKKSKRGQLKIYLGAAPGVGKTYAMLQDALAQRADGLDIIVGIVESHGRAEIVNLIKNFEILPLQEVSYHTKQLKEFDLDAALKRNPTIILMDEMAHTNVPGLRHNKRWQDIKEILNRGINVWTTLNVQHIESLNDDVAQIIHSRVNETIPDSMIETAESIELIDLPPDDLLKRLDEGKVYFPATAEVAKEHFFRKGNLIALRELALRITAEKVGAEVTRYRRGEGIMHIWPSKEKILVCINAGHEALKLIQTAKRMAASLQTDWMAVYVDNPHQSYSEQVRNQAIEHLRLAESMGAETHIIPGTHVVKEIINFAREENITHIIVWRSIKPRWREFFTHATADEMVRHSGEIDIYVVTATANLGAKAIEKKYNSILPLKNYVFAFAIVLAATVINLFLQPVLKLSSLMLIYILGTILVASITTLAPAIFAAIISTISFALVFVPQKANSLIEDYEYILTIILMFIIMLVVSYALTAAKHHKQSARLSVKRMVTLHNLSKKLSTTRGVNNILQIGLVYIGELFDSDVLALIPKDEALMICGSYLTDDKLNVKEMSIAHWVLESGQNAGLGTDTLSFSDALYIPLKAGHNTIGVIRIHPKRPENIFEPGKMRLLNSCIQHIASALEADKEEI